MRMIAGYLYRALYEVKEVLEHYHWLMVVFEIVLLFVGIMRVVEGLEDMSLHDIGDIALFSVLCLFLIADLLVRLRGKRRGYNFDRWLALLTPGRAPLRNEQQLIARLRELRALGLRGGLMQRGADSSFGRAVTQAIARESASVFSVKTLGTTDEEWARAETEYLHAWFEKFPAAIWRVPPLPRGAAARTPAHRALHGYFSVMAPITEESYRMIRRGHLNTALAHVDADAAAFASARRMQSYPKRLRLLAYAQIAVEPPSSRQTDLSPLFFSSLEHLAFLLRRFYPRNRAWRSHCDFSVICESSNATQSHALALLGFTVVKHSRAADAPAGKSPVGFTLFELNVQRRVGRRRGAATGAGDELLRFIERGLGPVSGSVESGLVSIDKPKVRYAARTTS